MTRYDVLLQLWHACANVYNRCGAATHDVMEVFNGELWKAKCDEVMFTRFNQPAKPSYTAQAAAVV